MVQNLLVGLALLVLQCAVVFWVGREVVARFQVGEVALDVAGGAGASGGSEADVGRHAGDLVGGGKSVEICRFRWAFIWRLGAVAYKVH